MVALASITQIATALGPGLASEMILKLEGVDGAASTQVGHALCLAASSFNGLSDKRRKEAVYRSWSSTYELVGMLNKDYIPCLESLFQSHVKSVMCTYFDCKQHFGQLNSD